MRVRLDPAASVGQQCRTVQRNAALLREHSYLGHAQLRALGGVGEMFDTLLVYENFPLDGLTAGTELIAAGATFRPVRLAKRCRISRSPSPPTWKAANWWCWSK